MWSDILWTIAMIATCVASSSGQLCCLEYFYNKSVEESYTKIYIDQESQTLMTIMQPGNRSDTQEDKDKSTDFVLV